MVVFRTPQSQRLLRAAPERADVNELRRLLGPVLGSHLHSKHHGAWLVQYTPLPTRLQDGPTCGLVALSLVGRQRGLQPKEGLCSDDDAEIEQLLAMARERSFSRQGEMFSAKDLATLAQDAYGIKATAVPIPDDPKALLCLLLKGHLILVAYDRDSDNTPCNEKGHKAHWAVIKGFVVPSKVQDAEDWCRLTWTKQQLEDAIESATIGDFFLICAHGKSRHDGFWKLSALFESNRQLDDPGDDVLKYGTDFSTPPNLDGLRNWMIVAE